MKNNKHNDALGDLMKMNIEDRIEAVHKDVQTKKDKYKAIDGIELAKTLGVPLDKLAYSYDFNARDYWLFYKYIKYEKVEQYFSNKLLLDEIEILKGKINRKRYIDLVNNIYEKKLKKKAVIEMLSDKEKEIIVKTAAKTNLENDDCCYIAYHIVYTKDKKELCFAVDEALFVNDNYGIYTPYDKRDRKFVYLENQKDKYLFTFLNDK